MFALVAMVLMASDARPIHVSVELSEGCPEKTEFARRLVYRTERVTLVAHESKATLWLSVDVSRARTNGFRGTLQIRTSEHPVETRELSGKRCETVIDALALAAALLLDPEAKMGPVPIEAPVPIAVEVQPVQPVEVQPVEVDAGVPEPAVLEAIDAGVVEPPLTHQDSARLTLALFAGAHVTTAISGLADFGGGAAAELALDRPLVSPVARLGLSLGSGRTLTAPAGAMGYALHALSRVELTARFGSGWLRPEAGLGLLLATVEVASLASDVNQRSLRWLPAPALVLRVGLFLGAWRVALHGELGPQLLRERYRVVPDGVVFTTPPVVISGGLQLGRALEP